MGTRSRTDCDTAVVTVPVVAADRLPWVTVEQMREVDRLMVASGVSLLQMMENAARNVAVLARQVLGGQASGRRVQVLAGRGSNGGGGLAAARHLVTAGAAVQVALSGAPPPGGAAAHQLAALQRWGVPVSVGTPQTGDQPDLVVDALLGYGQRGAPQGEIAALIAWAARRRVVALDVPSGLELQTGVLHHPAVHAAATVTLAAGKPPLRNHRHAVGDLYLADISVPAQLLKAVGAAAPSPFSAGPLVAIDTSA